MSDTLDEPRTTPDKDGDLHQRSSINEVEYKNLFPYLTVPIINLTLPDTENRLFQEINIKRIGKTTEFF